VVKVALVARDSGKLAALCAETGAEAFACDATRADEVARLFEAVEKLVGGPVMGNQVAK
jgi:NADP-dependent 3-hydroxy acid dehydrogenase YdfG